MKTAQELKALALEISLLSDDEKKLLDLFLDIFHEGEEQTFVKLQEMKAEHQAEQHCRPPQEVSFEKYVGVRVRQI